MSRRDRRHGVVEIRRAFELPDHGYMADDRPRPRLSDPVPAPPGFGPPDLPLDPGSDGLWTTVAAGPREAMTRALSEAAGEPGLPPSR